MRLGFHYHEPCRRAPDGRLQMSGPQGRFLDALAAQCEQLTCFLHSARTDELAYLDHTLRAPNIRWVDLGPHASLPTRILRSPLSAHVVRSYRRELDALLIRGPSPLLPTLARAARAVPTALLLVGDYVQVVRDSPQPLWRKSLLQLWAHANARGQSRAARRTLTLVNSRELRDRLRPSLPDIRETRTTTLRDTDFFRRDDTCGQRPVRLLYTGRMETGKGLLVLIEALAGLIRREEDVVFDLVGRPQRGDPVLDEALALARELGVGHRVHYHGYRNLGRDLFAFYQRADIYIQPSLRTEGFPRSLWEAMAHSLPVVATKVGSIPYELRDAHSARLITPRCAEALAGGIWDVLHDRDLRRRLIVNGFALARNNTLERRASELVSLIESWKTKQAGVTGESATDAWVVSTEPQ